MREATTALFQSGEDTLPTKGRAREIRGITLELTNPLARLSRSESRGRLFSCLGELCWYLSGSEMVEPVSYYITKYPKYAESDGIVHGAYGPRLFDFDGVDQVQTVISILKVKPDSRQAVIQIFDHQDLAVPYKHVPCTCLLQFFVRSGRLDAITYMRSNDIYKGLPHDIFAFTMVQEIIARSLGVELGTYTHMIGSLHLYETDETHMRAYIDEGWQSNIEMPSMPLEDPWRSLERFVAAEIDLRGGAELDSLDFEEAPYWEDLVRILAIFGLQKQGREKEIPAVRGKLSDPNYEIYLTDRFGL